MTIRIPKLGIDNPVLPRAGIQNVDLNNTTKAFTNSWSGSDALASTLTHAASEYSPPQNGNSDLTPVWRRKGDTLTGGW
jgi:hypothetical protein